MRRILFFALGLMACVSVEQGPEQLQQMIIVRGTTGSPRAKLELFENKKLVFGPVDAVVGKNGIALSGQKREGDGKTPQGLFKIESAFGYLEKVPTKLDYKKVTTEDKWIDDPNSPQYNQWVHGSTDAKSFEVLRRKDNLYKYAFVVGYNRQPVLPGLGSAIFTHVWRDANTGTAGCVAVAESHMKTLLSLLDKAKNPYIIIGTD